MSGGMTVEPVPQVNVDDLVAGTGEWSNLQKVGDDDHSFRLRIANMIEAAVHGVS